MQVALVVFVAIGLWIALLLVVVSLCRAAKRSDDAVHSAVAKHAAAAHDPAGTRSAAPELRLRTLSLGNAATLLGVSPETLLIWESRYGFPTSSTSERRYNQTEVLALRECLEDGLSISSAVVRAREQTRRRRSATAARLAEHRDGGLAS